MRIFCWVMTALLLLTGCHRRGTVPTQADVPEQKDSVVVADITTEAMLWADSVCRSMTLRHKVSQMFLPAVYASDDIWTMRLVREYADSCVGGVVLLKGNSQSAAALADSLQRHSRVTAFIAIDAEWGLAMRLDDAPAFPRSPAISGSADDQLMYGYGQEVARECRLLGVNMVLGPVVDVVVPGSFMSRRALGDDPVRVADLSLAYARGLEDGGVISVAKHFPGHGSVVSDSHKTKGIIERSLHQMDSVDLYPFRKWVENRLTGVMVGHLAVPSIDPEMRPAAVSHTVITELLRGDLGFSGLVLTDALNMRGAEGYGSTDAVLAGADIVVAPNRTFEEIDKVVAAVAEGRIDSGDIDAHVRRILFYKYLLGVPESGGFTSSQLNSEAADSLARTLTQ